MKIGHEMRYRTETMEGEKVGDGGIGDEWESLSARAKKRQQARLLQRHKGTFKKNLFPIFCQYIFVLFFIQKHLCFVYTFDIFIIMI